MRELERELNADHFICSLNDVLGFVYAFRNGMHNAENFRIKQSVYVSVVLYLCLCAEPCMIFANILRTHIIL